MTGPIPPGTGEILIPATPTTSSKSTSPTRRKPDGLFFWASKGKRAKHKFVLCLVLDEIDSNVNDYATFFFFLCHFLVVAVVFSVVVFARWMGGKDVSFVCRISTIFKLPSNFSVLPLDRHWFQVRQQRARYCKDDPGAHSRSAAARCAQILKIHYACIHL